MVKRPLVFFLYILLSSQFIQTSFLSRRLKSRGNSSNKAKVLSTLSSKSTSHREKTKSRFLIMETLLIIGITTLVKMGLEIAHQIDKYYVRERINQQKSQVGFAFAEIMEDKRNLCDFSNKIYFMLRENNYLSKIRFAIEYDLYSTLPAPAQIQDSNNPDFSNFNTYFDKLDNLEMGAEEQVRFMCSMNLNFVGESKFLMANQGIYKDSYEDNFKSKDQGLVVLVFDFLMKFWDGLNQDNQFQDNTKMQAANSFETLNMETQHYLTEFLERSQINDLISFISEIKEEVMNKLNSLKYILSIIKMGKELFNTHYKNYVKFSEAQDLYGKSKKSCYLIILVFAVIHIIIRIFVVLNAVYETYQSGDLSNLDNLDDGEFKGIIESGRNLIRAEREYIKRLRNFLSIEDSLNERKQAYAKFVWNLVKEILISIGKRLFKSDEILKLLAQFIPTLSLIRSSLEFIGIIGKYFSKFSANRKILQKISKDDLYNEKLQSHVTIQIEFAKCRLTHFILKSVNSINHQLQYKLISPQNEILKINVDQKAMKIKVIDKICTFDAYFCTNFFSRKGLVELIGESELSKIEEKIKYFRDQGPITNIILFPNRSSKIDSMYKQRGFILHKQHNFIFCRMCGFSMGLLYVEFLTNLKYINTNENKFEDISSYLRKVQETIFTNIKDSQMKLQDLKPEKKNIDFSDVKVYPLFLNANQGLLSMVVTAYYRLQYELGYVSEIGDIVQGEYFHYFNFFSLSRNFAKEYSGPQYELEYREADDSNSNLFNTDGKSTEKKLCIELDLVCSHNVPEQYLASDKDICLREVPKTLYDKPFGFFGMGDVTPENTIKNVNDPILFHEFINLKYSKLLDNKEDGLYGCKTDSFYLSRIRKFGSEILTSQTITRELNEQNFEYFGRWAFKIEPKKSEKMMFPLRLEDGHDSLAFKKTMGNFNNERLELVSAPNRNLIKVGINSLFFVEIIVKKLEKCKTDSSGNCLTNIVGEAVDILESTIDAFKVIADFIVDSDYTELLLNKNYFPYFPEIEAGDDKSLSAIPDEISREIFNSEGFFLIKTKKFLVQQRLWVKFRYSRPYSSEKFCSCIKHEENEGKFRKCSEDFQNFAAESNGVEIKKKKSFKKKVKRSF